MATRTINNIPFTTYVVKNESKKGANIYLGIASRDNNATTKDYFPHQVIACKTTYLFASIVGTRNVKITRPTTTDPYIYVETRVVDPKQCGMAATSLLKSGGSGGLTVRSVSSDSSITIEDYGCNYGLNTYRYFVQNACAINGIYYKTIGVPGKTNVIWQFKSIQAGNCVSMGGGAGVIRFDFDRENCCPCK